MDEITIKNKRYISFKKAAFLMGTSLDTVSKLCREHKLDIDRFGEEFYVGESDINPFVQGDILNKNSTEVTSAPTDKQDNVSFSKRVLGLAVFTLSVLGFLIFQTRELSNDEQAFSAGSFDRGVSQIVHDSYSTLSIVSDIYKEVVSESFQVLAQIALQTPSLVEKNIFRLDEFSKVGLTFEQGFLKFVSGSFQTLDEYKDFLSASLVSYNEFSKNIFDTSKVLYGDLPKETVSVVSHMFENVLGISKMAVVASDDLGRLVAHKIINVSDQIASLASIGSTFVLDSTSLTSATSLSNPNLWNRMIDKFSDSLVPLFTNSKQIVNDTKEELNQNNEKEIKVNAVSYPADITTSSDRIIERTVFAGITRQDLELALLNTKRELIEFQLKALKSIDDMRIKQAYKIGDRTGDSIRNSLENISGSTITNSSASLSTLTVDTDTLVVDAENGRVGIGSTSPFATLSVSGDIALTGGIFDTNSSLGTDGYILQSTGTGVEWVATSTLGFTSGGGGSGTVNSGTTGQVPYYAANGTTLSATSTLFISASGNVGIGTTTSSALLSLYKNSPTANQILFNIGTSDNASRFTVDEDGDVNFSGSLSGGNITGGTLTGSVYNASGSSFPIQTLNTAASAIAGSGVGFLNMRGTGTGFMGKVYATPGDAGYANSPNASMHFTLNNNDTEVLTLLGSGNVGIGTTTPSAKLDVWGNLNVGTSSTPTLFVDTANGNVGIGTTTPSASLHIVKADTSIRLQDSVATDRYFDIIGPTNSDNTSYIRAIQSPILVESTNSTGAITLKNFGKELFYGKYNAQMRLFDSKLVINTNGDVGIGTTSPYAKLSVAGSVVAQDFTATSTTATSTFAGGFSAASSLYVLQNGNVGIGTTSPTNLLSLAGSFTGGARSMLALTNTDTSTSQAVGVTLTSNDTVAGLWTFGSGYTAISNLAGGSYIVNNATNGHSGLIANGTNGYLDFVTGDSSAERMRITSTGNIGIGTTSPYAKLSVAGQVVGEYFTATSTTATSTFAGGLSAASSLYVLQNGNVGIGNSSPVGKLTVQSGNLTMLIGADVNATTITDATRKFVRVGMPHYTNTEEAIMMFTGDSTTSATSFNFGGGSAVYNAATALRFFTATNNTTLLGVERMTVDNTGNIGIGSTTPWGLLSVNPNGISGPSLVVGSSTATQLIVTNGGNVGIGTISPSYKLDIHGGNTSGLRITNDAALSAASGAGIQGQAAGTPSAADQRLGFFILGAEYTTNSLAISGFSEQAWSGSAKGSNLRFETIGLDSTTRTERMRISADGNIGIGTTSPFAKLSVSGDIALTGGIFDTNSSLGTDGYILQSTGTGVEWVATSTLGFTSGGSGTVNSGTTGQVAFYDTDGTTLSGTSTISFLNENIGIGSTTPSAKLTIKGSGTGTGKAFVVTDSSDTERFTILDNGNVGFGSTTPGVVLAGPRTSAFSIMASSPVQSASTLAGNSVIIRAAHATAGSSSGGANGGSLVLSAGNATSFSSGSGSGGSISLTAGNQASSDANAFGSGGNITLTAGASASANYGVGGSVTITAGSGTGSFGSQGGSITLTSGNSADGGAGNIQTGAVTIKSADTSAASTGDVLLAVGDTTANTESPGTLTIRGGRSNYTTSNPVASGLVQIVTQQGGSSNSSSGSGTAGGSQLFTLGAGGNASGATAATGGAGGTWTVAGAVGGNATGSGGTQLGGNGSALVLTSGAGGNATGASGTRTGGNGGNIAILTGVGGTGATANGTPGVLSLGVGGTTQLRIASDGNIGIGTTSPYAKLSVVGSVVATDFYSTSTTSGFRADNLLGGATNLTVDANGNIIRDPSDETLKENIQSIETPLDKVLKLRGVSYEWKDKDRFGTQTEIGLIAQEVELVVPEVVVSGGEYKSVNIKNLVALLIEAVKEIVDKMEVALAWFTDGKFRVQNDVCVDDVCVTKEQFKALLINATNENQTTTPSSNSESNSTETPPPPTTEEDNGTEEETQTEPETEEVSSEEIQTESETEEEPTISPVEETPPEETKEETTEEEPEVVEPTSTETSE